MRQHWIQECKTVVHGAHFFDCTVDAVPCTMGGVNNMFIGCGCVCRSSQWIKLVCIGFWQGCLTSNISGVAPGGEQELVAAWQASHMHVKMAHQMVLVGADKKATPINRLGSSLQLANTLLILISIPDTIYVYAR